MSHPPASIETFNLVDPAHYAAHGYPHEIWTWMRAHQPIYWWERTQGIPFWAITKRADIVEISSQPDTFVNGKRLVIQPVPEQRMAEFPPTLIEMDPPKHAAYRQIVAKRFKPKYLKRLHADIDRIGKQIVDDLVQGTDGGECDFVEKVSAPLPIAVIAWLLGVPESDWRLLFDWTNRIIGSADPEYQEPGKAREETARESMIEVFTYFSKLVEEKKKNPADDCLDSTEMALRAAGVLLPMKAQELWVPDKSQAATTAMMWDEAAAKARIGPEEQLDDMFGEEW